MIVFRFSFFITVFWSFVMLLWNLLGNYHSRKDQFPGKASSLTANYSHPLFWQCLVAFCICRYPSPLRSSPFITFHVAVRGVEYYSASFESQLRGCWHHNQDGSTHQQSQGFWISAQERHLQVNDVHKNAHRILQEDCLLKSLVWQYFWYLIVTFTLVI